MDLKQLYKKYSATATVSKFIANCLRVLEGRLPQYDDLIQRLNAIFHLSKSATHKAMAQEVDADDLKWSLEPHKAKAKGAVPSAPDASIPNALTAFEIWTESTEILAKYTAVLQIIEGIRMDFDVSESYKITIQESIQKLSTSVQRMRKDFALIDASLSEPLVQTLFVWCVTDPLKHVETIRRIYYQHPTVIDVYVQLMQRLVDHYQREDKSVLFQLLAGLEMDKNHALQCTGRKFKKLNENNPLQFRFGLVPVLSLMDKKALLDIIVQEPTPRKSDNFAAIAKQYSVGFIIFEKLAYTPLEYDFRNLIVDELANPYLQPQEWGINKKIIERYRTITIHKPAEHPKITVTVFGEESERFYVLETFDGKKYRPLAPWIHSNTYTLAKFRVKEILNKFPARSCMSRATEYHAQATKRAVRNMFLSKAIDMDAFAEKHTDIESGKMRSSIYDLVMKEIDAFVRRAQLETLADVGLIMRDETIQDAFARAVVSNYLSESGKSNTFDAGRFPYGEVLLSFTYELQTACRRFSREVHNGYMRRPLSELPATKTARIEVTMAKIAEVVQNAITSVIKLDDNLYTSIYYKYLILNYAI